MRKHLTLLISLINLAYICKSQVGINSNTPNSTLDVKTSISFSYSEKIDVDYNLNDSDFYVAYRSNIATGINTFRLPDNNSINNFKGRVYQIKNNSTKNLKISSKSNQTIRVGENNYINEFILIPGAYVEFVTSGKIGNGEWEMMYNSIPKEVVFNNVEIYTGQVILPSHTGYSNWTENNANTVGHVAYNFNLNNRIIDNITVNGSNEKHYWRVLEITI